MTKGEWQDRLPDGVQVTQEDGSGFRLNVSMPVGDDGLWPMRCPEFSDHVFKVQATVGDGDGSTTFCPYCGHEADSWEFASEQRQRLMDAARAAGEQYVADELDRILRKSFGGHSSSSNRSGFGIRLEFTPGPRPRRRSLPSYEIAETRRTMKCQRCAEIYAVYGLAIYCPNCGQLAPAQQFSELVRVHRERLAAVHSLPEDQLQTLTEHGVLAATYESTVKDGFSALETYLKRRFTSDAPQISLAGKGVIFQRLDDAADLFSEHLGIDLRAKTGPEAWTELLRVAAIRHVLVHNGGVIDAKLVAQLPDWPQAVGQRIQVERGTAEGLLDLLETLVN